MLFTKLVDKLYSLKWITSAVADEAKKEYNLLLDAVQHEHRDAFIGFDVKKKVGRLSFLVLSW